MARISYQNSTFRSFCKFDIRLLNWTFVLFISTFVLFASAFVLLANKTNVEMNKTNVQFKSRMSNL